MESWKRWEDQVVDSKFPLSRYLGGEAVFLTEYEGSPAAIKIVAANDTQFKQWQAAEKLSHPNLLRLLRAGRCRIDGQDMIYAVMEYADENLSQVLPERALNAQEAREMLNPALSALAYLHGQGLVHGRLKPANILAIGDQLKLSIDQVASGDPADDVKALGATLVEAVTQKRPMWPHLPETLEPPFRDIAANALHPDSAKRWTIGQIAARLQGVAPTKRAPVRWQYMLPVGAAGLAILVFAWRSGGSRTETPPLSTAVVNAQPQPSMTTTVAKPEPPVPPKTEETAVVKAEPAATAPVAETKPPEPVVRREPRTPETKTKAVAEKGQGIEDQVLPEIPHKAIATIHGNMVLNVRVQVDRSGSVSEAKLEPPVSSRYFAKYILDAAKRWKFKASDGPQEWTLRFVLTRKDTKVVPRRVN